MQVVFYLALTLVLSTHLSAQELSSICDEDGDGQVEFSFYLKGFKNTFNQIDKNKDGSLSMAEAGVVLPEKGQSIPLTASTKEFLLSDKNADYKLSWAEREQSILSELSKYDTDRNNKLDEFELANYPLGFACLKKQGPTPPKIVVN